MDSSGLRELVELEVGLVRPRLKDLRLIGVPAIFVITLEVSFKF